MTSEMELDLPSLTQAKLRSERIRILCMMGLFAAFVLLGLFRIIVPWKDATSMGWIVLGLSLAFLVVEAWMFRAISASLETGHTLDRLLGVVLAVLECSYPIVAMFVLMLLNPAERYTLLVSPLTRFC